MKYYYYYDSPIGILTLVENNDVLVGLRFGQVQSDGEERETALLNKVKTQLSEYFDGKRREFDLPLAFDCGTEFQRRAWEFLLTLPYGTSVSYGDVAKAAGNARAVRAAGNAVGRNPIAVIVPCHRVLAKGGALGGFSGGLDKKRFLLRLEGIAVK